jgi:hypothetical protein
MPKQIVSQRDEEAIQPSGRLQRIGSLVSNWLQEFLKQIGGLRDGFLVAAATTYGLGWFVWAVNAQENNLGLLPALEVQYFVAGIIPLLILMSVYWLVRGTILFRKWYSEKIKQKRLLGQVITWGWTASLGIWALLSMLSDRFPGLEPAAFAFLGVFIALLFFLPLSTKGFDWFLYFYRRFMIILFIVALGLVGISSYLYAVYPNIPQEFGGLRPRTAYLDVAKAELSKETLEEIFPSGVSDSNSVVVQSNKVDVYYSGNSFILVKLHGQDQDANQSTYEIKQSAIQVIHWYD